MDALQEAGHEVTLISRRTDEDEGDPGYRLRTAFRVATGAGRNPLAELEKFGPDIVHVHNVFPNYGTRWIAQWPGPVVVSLHNFRTMCSNGLFYRSGGACTDCVRAGNFQAVRHACYRGSRMATAPVALGRRQAARDLLDGASRIVTTSESFDRVLQQQAGRPLPTVVIPNFGAGEPQSPLPTHERSGWVAMGRFSAEKGFGELVRDWPEGPELVLIGDGPLVEELKQAIGDRRIELRGVLPIAELRTVLPAFTGLVLPSRWFEAAPQVVVEASRVGLPIIAFEANGVAELVHASGAGAVYRDSESLMAALSHVEGRLSEFSESSARMFEVQWRKERWIERIEALYTSLL